MRKESERQKVVELRELGLTYQSIAKEIGASTSWVRNVCIEHNLTGHYAKEVRYKEYQEYKAQGRTNKEVAEHFGISRKVAQISCVGIATPIVPPPNKPITENEKREYVERYLNGMFSYVDGYMGCDSKVTIRCNTCGHVFERSMGSIRHDRKTCCERCVEIEKEKLNEKLKQEAAEREEAARQRRIEKETERFLNTKLVQCVECGKIFSTHKTRQICCSAECSRRYNNHVSSRRKDRRIAKDKRIDKDITVPKLYKRDGGVCWICGGTCAMNDYIERDGIIICGNSYPSIDHIVPVCEGGLDSWENVRLAHRKCNSRRFFSERKPPVAV